MLDSIDLKVEAGEFLAIVGQNGSGKTTLAKHIVGLLQPATGRVTIDGKDRTQMRPAETARAVAYVFQNPDHQIFAATVEDEVAFGPRNFGLAEDEIRRRCDEALEAVGLQNERQSDPFLLSKGERQRLAVASVLVLRPRMLILDEPTTGLDHREQLRMMALVRDLNRAGIAIVIITHTPWLVAEYARRVVLMRKGAQTFRRRRARVLYAGRVAAVVVISGARNHRVEPPLRHAGPDHRRIRRVGERARLMPIYLYIDRGTFVHRLHPTVKVFALFVMFWSVYWVDQPIALLPVGLVMLWIAQLTDSWPNFYRLRWLFGILVFTTTIAWMVFYRRGAVLVNIAGLSRQPTVAGVWLRTRYQAGRIAGGVGAVSLDHQDRGIHLRTPADAGAVSRQLRDLALISISPAVYRFCA